MCDCEEQKSHAWYCDTLDVESLQVWCMMLCEQCASLGPKAYCSDCPCIVVINETEGQLLEKWH